MPIANFPSGGCWDSCCPQRARRHPSAPWLQTWQLQSPIALVSFCSAVLFFTSSVSLLTSKSSLAVASSAALVSYSVLATCKSALLLLLVCPLFLREKARCFPPSAVTGYHELSGSDNMALLPCSQEVGPPGQSRGSVLLLEAQRKICFLASCGSKAPRSFTCPPFCIQSQQHSIFRPLFLTPLP